MFLAFFSVSVPSRESNSDSDLDDSDLVLIPNLVPESATGALPLTVDTHVTPPPVGNSGTASLKAGEQHDVTLGPASDKVGEQQDIDVHVVDRPTSVRQEPGHGNDSDDESKPEFTETEAQEHEVELRRSTRVTAGQHTNPHHLPRSVVTDESVSAPPVLSHESSFEAVLTNISQAQLLMMQYLMKQSTDKK